MKKISFLGLCAALAGCATLVGCASTGPVKKTQTVSPTGLVSITANQDIGWYGEQKKSAGLLGDLIEIKVDAKTGETPNSLLPIVEASLRKALADKNIQVAESDSVIGSAEYAAAKEDKLLKASGMITLPGYRFVSDRDAALAKSLAKSANLASCMYVDVKFDKNMHTGVQKNGAAVACVTITLIAVNSEGKTIMQRSFYGSSKGTFAIVAGAYKTESLMALYPEAIDDACNKLAMSL